jgi:putative pre-16S rRNA nuclease
LRCPEIRRRKLTRFYNLRLPDFSPEASARRILALDVGKKRIGLAISDPLGITAQGLPTLIRTRIRDDLTQLVGKPLHMSGTESRQSTYTAEFGERLRRETGLPVTYWDERLTTVEAERMLRESGASLEKRKKAVDQLAAVLLLESFLEAQNLKGNLP